jgi:beta-glucosidase-like glycosyl hydrolase
MQHAYLTNFPLKHFAAHGAPLGGLHCNAWLGRGRRELLSEILPPFKAAIELGGGTRGVMMCLLLYLPLLFSV